MWRICPIRVRIARPEDGRQFSGAEGFQVKLTSPWGVSVGIPIWCQTGSIEAVGTICWPEVGENWISVTLDGRSLPGAPHAVQVAPSCVLSLSNHRPGRTSALPANERRLLSRREIKEATVYEKEGLTWKYHSNVKRKLETTNGFEARLSILGTVPTKRPHDVQSSWRISNSSSR